LARNEMFGSFDLRRGRTSERNEEINV
jgi:hypothetical protein